MLTFRVGEKKVPQFILSHQNVKVKDSILVVILHVPYIHGQALPN